MNKPGMTSVRVVVCSVLACAATVAAAQDSPVPAVLPPALHAADLLMRSHPAEAVELLHRAERDPGAARPAVRRALLSRLLRAELDIGDAPAAKAARQALFDLGTRSHDAVSLAWATLADIDAMLGDYRTEGAVEALAQVRRSIDFVRAPDLAFAYHMAAGRSHLLRAEYERAVEHFQAGVEMARRTEQPESSKAEAYRNLAYAYLSLNDTASAGRMVARALDVDQDALPARLRALVYATQAGVLSDQKRFAQAQETYGRALRVAQASGVKSVEPRILSDWADLALQSGDFVTAERLTRRALAIYDPAGPGGPRIALSANLGFALGGQGRVAEALPYIDGAIERFRQLGDSQSLLAIVDEKGRMLERQGRLRETLALLREQQVMERAQFTAQRGRALAVLQERFESQQNRRQIELLEKQNKLKDADIRNRELRLLALGLAVLLMVVVGVLVTMLYRRARKANAALRVLNEQLAEYAVRDPLTGLHNRRSFVADMQARMAPGVERRSGVRQPPATIMLLDLDHFKAVNDVHGHAAGDAVLVEVARRLQGAVRDSDTVLRWGGEEFVIHLPSCNAEQAAVIARRILDDVHGVPIDTGGGAPLSVSVSIGMLDLPFAGLDDTACDWQRALRLADQALYRAKNGGRNRCKQLLPARLPLAIGMDELERDLDGALAVGHVVMRTVGPGAAAPACAMS